ncbi:MAG: FAD:protein FMN transferase [Eubacteriales bacterium]|nr:FAD:protein FMN transferase [Eubacteriales bacterium]
MTATLSRLFHALGTMNTILVEQAEDYTEAADALERAERRVLELNDTLSVFRPESEVSRLNASAGCKDVGIGSDTMHLLKESKRYSQATGGAFSITTRPLSALWEINARCGTVPSRAEVEQALLLVNDEDILLDEESGTAALRRFGQAVDFGGIAKGYAADETRRILLEGGVTSALINLGGTVISLGKDRNVGIQHPDRCTGIAMGRVALCDSCAVTSGDYERYFEVDGVRYHHILDTKTGYPSRSELRSVTLIGTSAIALDAVSTAIFALGAAAGLPLADHFGAEFVVVTDALDVFCSEQLRGNFSLLSAQQSTRA